MITKFEKFMLEAHKGKSNAIMSCELESIFHCRGSDVRQMVNELRCNGVPICSSSKGYFYAESKDDILKTISHLDSRMDSIKKAKVGMSNLLK